MKKLVGSAIRISAFASDEPKLIRVCYCKKNSLPPQKLQWFEDTDYSFKQPSLGERSGLMGRSAPCNDSGIQVPSILAFCHPLGHSLAGPELKL